MTISSAEQHQLEEKRKKREEDERREEEKQRKERAKAKEEKRRRIEEERKAKAAADKAGEDRKGSCLMSFLMLSGTLAAIIAAVIFMKEQNMVAPKKAVKEEAAANEKKEEVAAKEVDSLGTDTPNTFRSKVQVHSPGKVAQPVTRALHFQADSQLHDEDLIDTDERVTTVAGSLKSPSDVLGGQQTGTSGGSRNNLSSFDHPLDRAKRTRTQTQFLDPSGDGKHAKSSKNRRG